jgi:hypothetical protein
MNVDKDERSFHALFIARNERSFLMTSEMAKTLPKFLVMTRAVVLVGGVGLDI